MSQQVVKDTLVVRLDRLWQSVARVVETVEVFRDFYRSSDTACLWKLPVGVDAFFLKIVRDALTDSLILQIGTLLDRSKGTLSLRRFVDQMAKVDIKNGATWTKGDIVGLHAQLESIELVASFIVDVRNNLVAHHNEAVVGKELLLPSVTFNQAEEIAGKFIELTFKLHFLLHGRIPDELPKSQEGREAIEYLRDNAELRFSRYLGGVMAK